MCVCVCMRVCVCACVCVCSSLPSSSCLDIVMREFTSNKHEECESGKKQSRKIWPLQCASVFFFIEENMSRLL